MPAASPPALIKAPLTGAFFVWATLAGTAIAGEPVRILAAVDGDTAVVAGNTFERNTLVRLIGINTPELGNDGAADEPLAAEAQRVLEKLIAGQPSELEYESERHDHYGRVLAHILLGNGTDPAETLLVQGLASVVAIPPNVNRLQRYLRLESQARSRRLGIWGDPFFAPVPARELDSRHAGFRFVTGQVLRSTRSRYGHHLWLSDRFALFVPLEDAGLFANLSQLKGKQVVARGWISARDGRLRMKLQHPAMLQVTERAPVHENSYYSTSPAE